MDELDRELLAFGRAVREAREQKGMTTAELAEAAGTDRESIEAIEAGQRGVRVGVVALAFALRVRPLALLTRTEELAADGEG